MSPDSDIHSRFAAAGRTLTSPLVAGVLCLAAAFLVYAPALSGGLIWDDFYLVRENPFFRSPVFGFEVFRHYLFFESFSTYYRPVQNWSYMLDYWLWRGSPFGYHCTNVFLHGLSGSLLFLLLRRLLPALWPTGEKSEVQIKVVALLVALVWTVHPVHNAAVAYISGRADSLAALFALAAWLLTLRALDIAGPWKKTAFAIAAAGSMLVALCSKEIALIWLILMTGHLWAFDRLRPARQKWIVLGGALAMLGLYAVMHALPGYRAPMQDDPPAPWDARVLLAFRALGDYTGLLLYPSRLYMERTLSDPAIYRAVTTWREHSRFEYLGIVGLLALLLATWLCLHRAPGQRLRLFGAAWFIVAFLPISNLFPLNAEVAEHWIYLASIGFLLFVAGTLAASSIRVQRVAVPLALVAIVGLGVRTSIRSGDWTDAETFCVRTIAAGGGTPRILGALAAVYGQRGDHAKQERVLRGTIARFPDYAPARINLGIWLSQQGRAAEAEALLGTTRAHADEASRQYPRTWSAALQLAQLRRAGDPAGALAIVREARARFPETWELVKYEVQLLKAAGDSASALAAVETYASHRWWHLDAQLVRGAQLSANGSPDAAIAALHHASRLDIHAPQALNAIAEIEAERGRADAALTAQFSAMERVPDRPTQYLILAGLLQKLGRNDEARAAMRKAELLKRAAVRGS